MRKKAVDTTPDLADDFPRAVLRVDPAQIARFREIVANKARLKSFLEGGSSTRDFLKGLANSGDEAVALLVDALTHPGALDYLDYEYAVEVLELLGPEQQATILKAPRGTEGFRMQCSDTAEMTGAIEKLNDKQQAAILATPGVVQFLAYGEEAATRVFEIINKLKDPVRQADILCAPGALEAVMHGPKLRERGMALIKKFPLEQKLAVLSTECSGLFLASGDDCFGNSDTRPAFRDLLVSLRPQVDPDRFRKLLWDSGAFVALKGQHGGGRKYNYWVFDDAYDRPEPEPVHGMA